MNAPRSGCPINLTLEALGDRWSLIVIRDLMFGNRRHVATIPATSNGSPPTLRWRTPDGSRVYAAADGGI